MNNAIFTQKFTTQVSDDIKKNIRRAPNLMDLHSAFGTDNPSNSHFVFRLKSGNNFNY
jgi:hypothetical protein